MRRVEDSGENPFSYHVEWDQEIAIGDVKVLLSLAKLPEVSRAVIGVSVEPLLQAGESYEDRGVLPDETEGMVKCRVHRGNIYARISGNSVTEDLSPLFTAFINYDQARRRARVGRKAPPSIS